MINAIIIEDEKKSRELLEKLIEKGCPEVTVIGTADSVETGVELIRRQKPRLIFLDIEMPDGSGFDVLKAVPEIPFEVIFTTASDRYAINAIKYSALDYLLKPIDIEELKAAVKKIAGKDDSLSSMENLKFLIQNFRKSDEQYSRITLPTGNAYEIVNVKDIIRCEAEGNYTSFFLTDKRKMVVTLGLKHYEDLLPPNDFFRIHNHHLVNVNHVTRVLKEDGGYAIMSDGSKIEISRRKKESFISRIHNL
ncbi:MAG TPA: LytTR family DNA-binding domain-containing protein [Bacteroidia bacterium]|jgi:two-component system LytT family response regulator|nr:LytTR family DNA-binding domain-containing protein [Bacteroidia bacterium]